MAYMIIEEGKGFIASFEDEFDRDCCFEMMRQCQKRKVGRCILV